MGRAARDKETREAQATFYGCGEGGYESAGCDG